LAVVFKMPFDAVVEELESSLPLKDDTLEGDVIVIAREGDPDRTAADFAVVTGFERDPAKRDEWWHVGLLFLSFPPVEAVLTLQAPHFVGREVFTMGGKKTFIKALDTKSSRGKDGGGGPGPAPKPTFKIVR
jgi:hypothetical protein